MGGPSLFDAHPVADPLLAGISEQRAMTAAGLVAWTYRVEYPRTGQLADLTTLLTELAPMLRPPRARELTMITWLGSPTGHNSCGCSRGMAATSPSGRSRLAQLQRQPPPRRRDLGATLCSPRRVQPLPLRPSASMDAAATSGRGRTTARSSNSTSTRARAARVSTSATGACTARRRDQRLPPAMTHATARSPAAATAPLSCFLFQAAGGRRRASTRGAA